jgi:uncharacterized protein (DUF58 family)
MLRSWLVYAVFLVSALAAGLFLPSPSGTILIVSAVAVPAACAAVLRLARAGIEIEVDAPDHVYKGRPARAVLRVKPSGAILPGIVRAEVDCVNTLTGERAATPVSLALSARGGGEIDMDIEAIHCGLLTFSVRDIRLYDALGLTYVNQPAGVAGSCLTLPDLFTADVVTDPSGSLKGDVEYSAGKPGYDLSEPLWIRDYADGDSPKAIHWKLTGKFDRLMVKEPGLPVENSVLLLMETGAPSEPLPTPAERSGTAENLISLSQSLLSAGVPHTVGWRDKAEGSFVRHRLDAESDLFAVMPKALAAGHEVSEVGCLQSYARLFEGVEQARVVIVSAGETYNDDDCAPLSRVTRLTAPAPGDTLTV